MSGHRRATTRLAAVVVAFGCARTPAPLTPTAAPAVKTATLHACGAPPVRADAQPQPAAIADAAEGRAVVEALARADGARATRRFGASMLNALPAAKAVEVFKTIEAHHGAFEHVDWTRSGEAGPFRLTWVAFRLEKTELAAKIAFDEGGDIVGLFFVAPSDAPQAAPVVEAPDESIEECDVEVGARPALPGTLALPRGAHAAPAVVLVHGSGPGDRDETVGQTRVFADLSRGLVARGLVVLRYDKRTRVDPRGVVTVKEEVIDGALAAVQLLRGFPEVDPRRVFVLGHSQGGALAPRIAAADGRLGGIIVLAGPTRPLEDLLLEQLTYLVGLAPTNAALREQVEAAKTFRTLVQSPTLEPSTVLHLPGGGKATGAYFLDLRGYHPDEAAAALACPVLVMQGGRDYQVSATEDYGLWEHSLAGNPRATLRAYPALDHRFVAGEGPSTPASYAAPAHVAPEVVADIASWIAAQPSPRSLR